MTSQILLSKGDVRKSLIRPGGKPRNEILEIAVTKGD